MKHTVARWSSEHASSAGLAWRLATRRRSSLQVRYVARDNVDHSYRGDKQILVVALTRHMHGTAS